jgi:SulP family sulfate permease
VLVGVGISWILFIIRQSNQLDTRRLVVSDSGGVDEIDPPAEVPAHDVVVLQPYGSLFFASAPMFESQLPDVTEDSVGSVVILRFRGKPDVGSTLIEVLVRYSVELDEVDSKMMIVTDSERIIEQLDRTGATEKIGASNIYRGRRRLMATVIRATNDAGEWVSARAGDDDTSPGGPTIADVTLDLTPPPAGERADGDSADGDDDD